ncbi:hypothetical protein [Cohnella phaseoli]|uniref:Uncharacterized protein n=1 Tax=Cohnella phaseoli TaxID=456490 RepID=A0A3D9KT50_9BACL|nr:hypothetical protein [Cohnella phaseoli]RED89178.1 hypothetical protein DFP98_101149 [Cohnella phaseoli]
MSSAARLAVQPAWNPYKDGIFVASIGAGRQVDVLYVGSERRIMARYPKYEENKTLNGYAADALSKERAAIWSNPEGGYIRALHFREWLLYYSRSTVMNWNMPPTAL